jgi:hypothetical protein
MTEDYTPRQRGKLWPSGDFGYYCPHCGELITELRQIRSVTVDERGVRSGPSVPRGPYKVSDDFLHEIVDLLNHQGHTVAEVATIKEVSERTVKRWAQYARERGVT